MGQEITATLPDDSGMLRRDNTIPNCHAYGTTNRAREAACVACEPARALSLTGSRFFRLTVSRTIPKITEAISATTKAYNRREKLRRVPPARNPHDSYALYVPCQASTAPNPPLPRSWRASLQYTRGPSELLMMVACPIAEQ